MHIGAVVHAYLYRSVEDSVVARYCHLVDIHIKFVGKHLAHVVKHALAVDTTNLDGGVEEHLSVHIPFRIEYAVAETRLQACRHLAVAAVYFYAVLVVDEAEDVVARNGVTA